MGTGVRPQSETDFVIHSLFGDADGMVAVKEMEATLGELPGLERQPLPHGRAGRSGGAGSADRSGSAERSAQSRGRTFVPSGVSMTSRPIAWSSSRSSSERA